MYSRTTNVVASTVVEKVFDTNCCSGSSRTSLVGIDDVLFSADLEYFAWALILAYFNDFQFFNRSSHEPELRNPTSWLLLGVILSQYYEEVFDCKGAVELWRQFPTSTPISWSCDTTSQRVLKFRQSIKPPPTAHCSGHDKAMVAILLRSDVSARTWA